MKKLHILTIFEKPIARNPHSAPKEKLTSQGLVWEGICGDPAFIVQVWHTREFTRTWPGLTKDKLFRDEYEITIVPIRDFKSLADVVPARFAVDPDGFSLIDGRDAEGYDREGYDSIGWNRAGLNKAGERWSGLIASGRQGRGVLTAADGTRYVGTFRDDVRDGWGVRIGTGGGGEVQRWERGTLKEHYPLGGKILSPLHDWLFLGRAPAGSLLEGRDPAISADGAWMITDGLFRGGRLVEGTMEGPDGTQYIGRFSGDQLVQGTIRGTSGWTYSGGLSAGKPSGKGIVAFPDGTRYEGEFTDGSYHGQGVLTRTDGEKYEGAFRNGKPHGMGIYFNGESVERCEYYDGKRIDQAYLIKMENEKQIEALRVEREKAAKERADQAELARLAAERAESERQAQAGKSSNKLMAGIFGVGAALAGGSVGMSGAEAALYGARVAQDVAKGDASMAGSKAAAQSIVDARAAGSGPGTAASGAGSASPATGAGGTPAAAKNPNVLELQVQGKNVFVRRDIAGISGSYRAEGGRREEGINSFLDLFADGRGRLFVEKGYTLDFEFTGDERKEKAFIWGILCLADGTPDISDTGNMGIVLKSTADNSETIWSVNSKNGKYYFQGGVWVHR